MTSAKAATGRDTTPDEAKERLKQAVNSGFISQDTAKMWIANLQRGRT